MDYFAVDLGGTACSMTENAYANLKKITQVKLNGKGEEISPDRVVLRFDERILNRSMIFAEFI